jgi:hypothetical protein
VSEAPDTKEALTIVRNRRTDAMFVAAYLAIGALCYVVVYENKIGEFAQGIVTLVLGMFLNELKGMYSYETGTTRGAQAKDATIGAIATNAAQPREEPK